jgi:death on curing protein
MPWDGLCSLDRLLELHARGLREHKGAAGIRDLGCPEGTLGNAWSGAEYSEIGESLPHLVFASYLLYYFATKQCFIDGNKRIAWLTMSEVLASVNLEVNATTDEAYAFCIAVANKQVRDVHSVVMWVSARLRELQPLPAASPVSSPLSADEPKHERPQQAKLV